MLIGGIDTLPNHLSIVPYQIHPLILSKYLNKQNKWATFAIFLMSEKNAGFFELWMNWISKLFLIYTIQRKHVQIAIFYSKTILFRFNFIYRWQTWRYRNEKVFLFWDLFSICEYRQFTIESHFSIYWKFQSNYLSLHAF